MGGEHREAVEGAVGVHFRLVGGKAFSWEKGVMRKFLPRVSSGAAEDPGAMPAKKDGLQTGQGALASICFLPALSPRRAPCPASPDPQVHAEGNTRCFIVLCPDAA